LVPFEGQRKKKKQKTKTRVKKKRSLPGAKCTKKNPIVNFTIKGCNDD